MGGVHRRRRLWAPTKLADQLAALHTAPRCRWVCGGAVLVDEHLEIVGADRPRWARDVSGVALRVNPVPGGASGTVIDVALARAVGGFDERFSVLADWDLWIRLAAASPLAVVERPLHAYRLHQGALSSRPCGTREEIRRLQEKYAAARRAAGVAVERERLELWLAQRAQRAGHRRAAAAGYLRAGAIVGHARSVGRAAEALVWPGAFRLRDRRRGARVDPDWRAAASAWLREEDRPAPPCPSSPSS